MPLVLERPMRDFRDFRGGLPVLQSLLIQVQVLASIRRPQPWL